MAVSANIPELLDRLEDATPQQAMEWVQKNADWLKLQVDKHKQWIKEERIEHYQALYDGDNEQIETREKDRGDGINKKINPNYAALLIDTVVDYMLGKELTWTIEDPEGKAPKPLVEEYRKKLLKMLRSTDAKRVLSEQLRQGLIASYSAVMAWVEDNGKIDYEEFPANEIIPIYDTRGRLQLVIRYYEIDDVATESRLITRTRLEIYDKRYRIYAKSDEAGLGYVFDEDELEIVDQVQGVLAGNPYKHQANRIPVSIFTNGVAASYNKRNDRNGVSDLSTGIEKLLTEYAAVVSDKGNTVDRLLDQYLLLVGVDTDGGEVSRMRQARALALKSENSKASFIAPSQEDTAVENHLNRLKNDIFETAGVPRLSELSGATATEIRVKYGNLIIKAGKKETYFTSAVKSLIEILTDFLNLENGKTEADEDPEETVGAYNPEWVSFTLQPNVPHNYQEIATIVAQLSGIVPDSYLYELLWFMDDPVAALKEMKKQKQEAVKESAAAFTNASGYGGEFSNTNNNSEGAGGNGSEAGN
jgi:SPP1 family phage portal protein